MHVVALRVAELFAGVGGFRRGLEAAGHDVVWWNQWEPSTKTVQYAYDCYRAHFHANEKLDENHNRNIEDVPTDEILDHDLLVGGFPCQDYSVMTSLRSATGLRGKKGKLWFSIERILNEKKSRRPDYLLLENVPRLLLSPKAERGRDFAVILRSLSDLGYRVEWRVVTGDDYGCLQRRRRVFIFAAHRSTPIGEWMTANFHKPSILTKGGFFAGAFPVKDNLRDVYHEPIVDLPKEFPQGEPAMEPTHWCDAGIMVRSKVHTLPVIPDGKEPVRRLGDEGNLKKRVKDKFYLSPEEVKKWRALKKGGTSVQRKVGDFTYKFAEGRLSFPENLERSARTILTSEGSRTPNRTTHVVKLKHGKRYRFLTPEECERLNGFPEGWTAKKPTDRPYETPDRWRYFMMGNALIVDLVESMGHRLNALIKEHGAKKQATAVKAHAKSK